LAANSIVPLMAIHDDPIKIVVVPEGKTKPPKNDGVTQKQKQKQNQRPTSTNKTNTTTTTTTTLSIEQYKAAMAAAATPIVPATSRTHHGTYLGFRSVWLVVESFCFIFVGSHHATTLTTNYRRS
jgi:hypothetical protein